jgi:hypothetical protein
MKERRRRLGSGLSRCMVRLLLHADVPRRTHSKTVVITTVGAVVVVVDRVQDMAGLPQCTVPTLRIRGLKTLNSRKGRETSRRNTLQFRSDGDSGFPRRTVVVVITLRSLTLPLLSARMSSSSSNRSNRGRGNENLIQHPHFNDEDRQTATGASIPLILLTHLPTNAVLSQPGEHSHSLYPITHSGMPVP